MRNLSPKQEQGRFFFATALLAAVSSAVGKQFGGDELAISHVDDHGFQAWIVDVVLEDRVIRVRGDFELELCGERAELSESIVLSGFVISQHETKRFLDLCAYRHPDEEDFMFFLMDETALLHAQAGFVELLTAEGVFPEADVDVLLADVEATLSAA